MIVIKIDTSLDKVNAILKELGNANITSLPCEPIPGVHVCEDKDIIMIELETKPEEKKRRKNGI